MAKNNRRKIGREVKRAQSLAAFGELCLRFIKSVY